MLEGNDIICFANDWDGDPLSKKHIALRLAQKNRVLWVNSTGNPQPHGFGPGPSASMEETAAIRPGMPPCVQEHLGVLTAGNSLSRQPGGQMGEPPAPVMELAPRLPEARLSKTDHLDLRAQLGRCRRLPG